MSFLYLDTLTHIDVIVFLYELMTCSVLHHPLLSCIIQYLGYKKCGYRQSDHSFWNHWTWTLYYTVLFDRSFVGLHVLTGYFLLLDHHLEISILLLSISGGYFLCFK